MAEADDIFTVEVKGADKAIREVSRVFSRTSMRGMNGHIGVYVTEKLKDFLDEMSVSRHKTADRLGAKPTHYLEYASGRSGSGRQTTELGKVDNNEINITIRNTPGLKRAYGPLDITPRRARALTIPLAAESYGKTVANLRRAGHVLFRPKGRNVLVEDVTVRRKGRRKKGESATVTEIRPMYALVKRVHIPQDRGLLPTNRDFALWAADAAEGWFMANRGE
jgi:hypothetical protein